MSTGIEIHFKLLNIVLDICLVKMFSVFHYLFPRLCLTHLRGEKQCAFCFIFTYRKCTLIYRRPHLVYCTQLPWKLFAAIQLYAVFRIMCILYMSWLTFSLHFKFFCMTQRILRRPILSFLSFTFTHYLNYVFINVYAQKL